MQNSFLNSLERSLPALISAGLVIFIGYILAKLIWHFLTPAPDLSAKPVTTSNVVAQPTNTRVDYGAEIARQHLFGKAPTPKNKPVAKAPEPIKKPKIKLSIRLHGVVAAGKKDSYAIISGNGKPGQQVFGIGEPLIFGPDKAPVDGVEIVEIHTKKIIVNNNGHKEEFTLPEVAELDLRANAGRQDDAPSGGQKLAAHNPVAAPRHVQQPVLKPNTIAMGGTGLGGTSSGGAAIAPAQPTSNGKGVSAEQLVELRETIMQNPDKILEIVSISEAKDKEGNFVGFRLTPGNNRAVFRGLGLKAGDIAKNINGIELDSPQRGLEVMNQLTSASSLSITVLRGQQQFTINRELAN